MKRTYQTSPYLSNIELTDKQIELNKVSSEITNTPTCEKVIDGYKKINVIEFFENSNLYNESQLQELKWGVFGNIDFWQYADPKLDSGDMHDIYNMLVS
jgi:hypothetical protein